MPSAATLQNLLDQMQRNSDVLNGWDVVFNMLVDPVNRLFEIMYASSGYSAWQTVDLTYCQALPNPSGDGQIAAYTDLRATLAAPALTFGPGGKAVVEITFQADGELRQAARAVGDSFDPARGSDPDDPSLDWKSTPLASETFVATVPLAVIHGRTNQDPHGFRVIVDFPAGSFRFPTLQGAPEPTELSRRLQAYFAANDVEYVLNTVDTAVSGQLPALTPTSFRLNTLQTNAGKSILQFFVTTIGKDQANATVDVNEPIPDGDQVTIMIRKGIADQLGGDQVELVSLFAVENLVFPGTSAIVLDNQYHPRDMLATGRFDLEDSLEVVGGDGQQVVRDGGGVPGGIASFGPLQVKALNALDQPNAGVAVSFAAGTYPPGMAIQFSPGDGRTASATTGDDGVATLEGADGTSLRCYYAEGPFKVVATAPGGKTATFDLTVAPTPPPPDLSNCTVTVVSGNGQRVARSGEEVPGGQARFAPLQVVVKDQQGQVVPGARVQWDAQDSPGAMAVQVDPSGASPATSTTNDQGVATLAAFADGKSVYCYYAEGAFKVVASVNKGGSATFDLAVVPTPPPPDVPGSTVTIVSGNGQRVARSGTDSPGGQALFAPLSVVVREPGGQVAPGAQVRWAPGNAPGGMAVQVDPSGASPKVTTADADGVATLAALSGHSVACYYDQGAFEVVASVDEGGSATFDLTVAPTPPPPQYPDAVVRVTAGDGQSAARQDSNVPGGMAMFAPMQVSVKDPLGNPIPGVPVDWNPGTGPAGMAVQVHPSGGAPATVLTDADGVSTLERMPGGRSVYCYYGAGPFTVTASVPGGPTATFHGTVTG